MAANSLEPRKAGAAQASFGLSAALATPFTTALAVDLDRMVAHGQALLADGCSSLTLFGTTGEGASLGAGERRAVQRAMLAEGVAPGQLVVGLAATDLETAAAQLAEAVDAGITTLLAPPPFYFKGVGDDGLHDWYAVLLDHAAARGARVILYHIPQVTGVGLSLQLVRRLWRDWGETVFGVKDSSGHWPTTAAFLGEGNFAVLVGDERHLAAAVRLGGAGAISGLANLLPAVLAKLVASGRENTALDALTNGVCAVPVTPAIKALVGVKRGAPEWRRVRPPLQPTAAADVGGLERLLDAVGTNEAA